VHYVQLPQEFLAGHMPSGDAAFKEIVAGRALAVLRRLAKRREVVNGRLRQQSQSDFPTVKCSDLVPRLQFFLFAGICVRRIIDSEI
jgi:hypothetical protein